MDFQPIERPPGAFQEGVEPDLVRAMCERAFGPGSAPTAAVELGDGAYNSTYRVEFAGAAPVILRVAPEPRRQLRAEREFMRNEHASLPYLAPIASLLPRTLAIDFTHEIVGRDYLFQTHLPGVPAPRNLEAYPRPRWRSFYRQLGTITRRLHEIRGERYGRLDGPTYATWSEATVAGLADIAADCADLGLDDSDVRELIAVAEADRATLDGIAGPRLLHGDLWTVNVMIDPDAPEPTIVGVFDCDRTSWGDPEYDWTLHMAGRRPGTERDSFWETYGPLDPSPEAVRRRLYYEARNFAAARLERHRLGVHQDVPDTYDRVRNVLARLRV